MFSLFTIDFRRLKRCASHCILRVDPQEPGGRPQEAPRLQHPLPLQRAQPDHVWSIREREGCRDHLQELQMFWIHHHDQDPGRGCGN